MFADNVGARDVEKLVVILQCYTHPHTHTCLMAIFQLNHTASCFPLISSSTCSKCVHPVSTDQKFSYPLARSSDTHLLFFLRLCILYRTLRRYINTVLLLSLSNSFYLHDCTLIQSVPSLPSPYPHHLSLPFLVTSLTGSSPNSSLSFAFLFLSFTINRHIHACVCCIVSLLM